MKLRRLTLCNFQSFGPDPKTVAFRNLTFFIGANGSGKTAVLQALSRMFSFDPNLRRVQRSDFHVPATESPSIAKPRSFWVEADFVFPELRQANGTYAAVPTHFAHMRLDTGTDIPRVRYRLEATLDSEGGIEDVLSFVLDVDANGTPLSKHPVSRTDRNHIHFHYLPARRDPSEQVVFTASSLLGRTLRSANWQKERASIKTLTESINGDLVANKAVHALTEQLAKQWKGMHKGDFFADAKITFANSEIEALLRHMSISFSPGHDEQLVDFARLSDGQKSMLYLSLVLSMQSIGRAVINGDDSFDPEKLKPAVFTLIGMEEPENSLSPHYLGRIVQALQTLGKQDDAQAVIATHAPSMLRRVLPENIRYLRLNGNRESEITRILLPLKTDDQSHKFVKEAVQAYPELYFSRLVLLGEGDSEEVVLPRVLKALGLGTDEAAISIAPLGGRHVNHFWRLFSALGIPCLTLLDLDLCRHEGGWGRIRYAVKQLSEHRPGTFEAKDLTAIPKWDAATHLLKDSTKPSWLDRLEGEGVFFSDPLDLDFSMLKAYPEAYGVDVSSLAEPDADEIRAVLGKSHGDLSQYSKADQQYFPKYYDMFKLSSKPVAHINALANLTDEQLIKKLPASMKRLVDAVIQKLKELPE